MLKNRTDFEQCSLLRKLALGVLPLSAIALHSSPGFAQANIPGATTICAYDLENGVSNVLGMRSYITVGQVGNDTQFVFEQFPAPVLNENDQNIRTDVQSERRLTIYGTPIEEARQILVDSANSYAALVGLESDREKLEDFGFAAVNATLTCKDVSGVAQTPPAPNPATPTAPTPETQTPSTPPTAQTLQTSFADLPNGNYRVTSATYPNRVVSNEELVQNGGTLFRFRKFGEEVTGIFSYIDSDRVACIAGKIEGNKVTGQAYTDSDVSLGESTAIFLGPGGYLQLGQNNGGARQTGARRYDSAVLNLDTFSRINAGAVLPPESCR